MKHRKLIYIIGIILIIFTACANTRRVEKILHIEVVDGCEYVLSIYSSRGGIIHHAACNNREHIK